MGLSDLTIGRYYPAESLIHEIDTKVKIISIILLSVAAFTADNFFALFFVALFTLLIFVLSKLPIIWLYKAVKPAFYILSVAFFFQLVFTPGRTFLNVGIIKLTYEGLILGAFVLLRVLIIIVTGSLITFTTQPITIADALESLLKPLRVFRLPVHEVALTVTLALRFIPELLVEAQKIAFAQQARGADFKTGNVFKRAKSLIPLFIPLFVSAFLKAEGLGKAMEARSYSGSQGRTKIYEDKLNISDYVSLLIVITVLVITVNI